ncbi:hypothetical protein LCGC14_1131380 [marine sediment metagenome]|uniref:Uncharacterized protein n=1 Tax=marine sediment metagenome TaxID=412755 RepID=A0A0F9M0X3_9ZZZZ
MIEHVKRWRERNGRLIHDGDCWFWGVELCTCGLLHYLMPLHEQPEWFWKEQGAHERQIARIPKPLPYIEPTKEELAECQKMIDEIFPKDSQKDGPKT